MSQCVPVMSPMQGKVFLLCYAHGRLFPSAVEVMNLAFNSPVLLFLANISCCFRAFCMVSERLWSSNY